MSSGKIDPAIPRIVQFLLLALSPGATEGERTNALGMARRELEKVGSDAHELGERIKTPPLSEEEMKKIFDAGRAQGRAEEIEHRQRSVTAITAFADGDVGEGINGYSWREIVGHCVLNKHRIRNSWEADFIQSVAEQLAKPYHRLTEKQAPIVRRIFLQWFDGKIT
jgi:hypothetical protein